MATDFTEETAADAVVDSFAKTPDPRLRELLSSLVRHLHAFVRETEPTIAEWEQAIEFLTATGQKCDDERQEFILLSDVLGVSMLVETINNRKSGGATESTVLGPFHMIESPRRELGDSIDFVQTGTPCLVLGRVLSSDGSPLPGAELDVWQASDQGFYDVQQPGVQPRTNGRGLFTADADGAFWFRTVDPSYYPIPTDGPVGTLLNATGRHPYRPAHIHFIVTAPGHRALTTHIFVAGSQYIESDAVFAVKKSLIKEFTPVDDPDQAARYHLTTPFSGATFDIILQQDSPARRLALCCHRFCTSQRNGPAMTDDDLTHASSPASRPPAREVLALVLGLDAAQVPAKAGDGSEAAPGTLLPPPLQLFGLSFLMLFVELALIRWSGALVIYLSYFSNFVLLGSFLGIGIGFLRARARVNLFPWAPAALALLILYVRVFPVEVVRTGNAGIIFFGAGKFQASGPPTWVTLPIVFLAVAAVMAMIGEGVARAFVGFRPLDAYRLDIAGSIAGIAAFSLLSFLDAKPVVWAFIVAVVMLLLYGRRAGLLQVVAVAAVVVLLWSQSLSSSDIWSPYYRISVQAGGPGHYSINVNGIPHQNIIPARQLQKVYSQPYFDAPANPLNDVLIVGAGTGDDVANALLHGARHIDAVEIDPELHELGVKLNPDHPYQDPRVTVHINDGRAFLEQTHTRYDMILFALPDSLTLVAGQSSLRLESYLFTLQAVQAAKAHLNPDDGLFAMYNYYRTPWLRDRLANTLQVAFGHTPCVDNEGFSLSMISDTVHQTALHCGTAWHRPADVVPPATDDHPFVYLDGNSIPWLYRITLSLILLVTILLVRPAAGPYRRMSPYLDLFFMGAAFLLLETKNIVQFALLFGTTWFVNALVTAGVLVAVLAAVEVSRHVRVRRPALLYVGLLAALAVAWAVPPSSLLSLSPLPRFATAVIIAFAPIFLANMVFAQRFRDTGDSATAFGANLLGAILGGIGEYASLVVGYRWLLVFVAVLYALAFLTGWRHLRPAARQ